MDKDEFFMEKLGISRADIDSYYKVQRYFYIMDAFAWCEMEGKECSNELAEAMADFLCYRYDSTVSHWGNFEGAYYALKEG